MNFRRGQAREEPEINLIPLIDVLLVVLIFMMVTTTYSKFSELQINLPQATGEKTSSGQSDQLNIGVDATEHYSINHVVTPFGDVDKFSQELRKAAGDQKDPMIIINADAKASHQSVINIMEAARIAGYSRITFTTTQR